MDSNVVNQDEVVERVVERAFPGARVVDIERLSGGISAGAAAMSLALASGDTARLVVRRPKRGTLEESRVVAQSEHALLTRCAALGISAPRPRFIDVETATILLDYIEGAPDFAPRDSARMLEQLALELARIHAVPLDAELTGILPRRAQTVARMVQKVPLEPDHALGELELRALLGTLSPWPQLNADALLHGDYWPGNTLWRDGKLVAVVDWEESELGDPLSDISIARLDIAWAFGEAAMSTFTGIYREHTDLDWRNLARWDLLTALRPMGNLARWAAVYPPPPIGRPDIDEPHMRAVRERFVEAAKHSIL